MELNGIGQPSTASSALPSMNPSFFKPNNNQGKTRAAAKSRRGSQGAANSDASDADDDSDYVDSDHRESDDDHVSQYQTFLRAPTVGPGAPHHDPSAIRVAGGHAAVTKRITVNLDSDDEIIKEMKDMGYKDIDVQRRLVGEGRVKYAEKSITTRYTRIQRALAAKLTQDLDDELTDWHVGDDDILDKARNKYEGVLTKGIEQVKDRYWLLVSKDIHEVQKKRGDDKIRFSKNACRDRSEARMNGSAKPAFEEDPDRRGREAARNARIQEIAEAKAVKDAEDQRKEDEIRKKQEELLSAEDQRRHKHMSRTESKQLHARVAADKAAERARLNTEKKEIAQKRKEERARAQAERQEKAVLSRMKKSMHKQEIEDRRERDKADRARRKLETEMAEVERQKEDIRKKFEADQNRREVGALVRRVMNDALDRSSINKGEVGISRPRLGANTVKEDRNTVFEALRKRKTVITPEFDGSEVFIQPSRTNVTNVTDREFLNDPVLNPRWGLKQAELKALCKKRGIKGVSHLGHRETVQALLSADMALTVLQLRTMLTDRGLPQYGDKTSLIWRISNDDAGKLAKGSDMHEKLKKGAVGLGDKNDTRADSGHEPDAEVSSLRRAAKKSKVIESDDELSDGEDDAGSKEQSNDEDLEMTEVDAGIESNGHMTIDA